MITESDSEYAGCERLYGAPVPMPEEAPSSWVQRLAIKYSWSIQAMAKHLSWGRLYSELDFSENPPDRAKLERITNADVGELAIAFSVGKTVLSLPIYRCLTVFRSEPIRQFCPMCLAEDAIPYHRIGWRLASTSVCRQHGVMLRSACPHCDRTILVRVKDRPVLSREMGTRYLDRCRWCGKPLSEVEGQAVDRAFGERLAAFQELAWDVMKSGRYTDPVHGEISAEGFLDVFLLKISSIERRVPGRPLLPSRWANGYLYTGVNWERVIGKWMECAQPPIDAGCGTYLADAPRRRTTTIATKNQSYATVFDFGSIDDEGNAN